jgi:hypothetical protein
MLPAHRAITFGLCAALVVLCGCKSAEEKCREAQGAAQASWTSYHTELQRLHAAAVTEQAEAQAKLSGPIEKRLSEAATKQADQRYDRTSSAWLRAYDAAMQTACSAEPECSGLKERSATAKQRSEELAPRLIAAQAAVEATTDLQAKAQAAAASVRDDFERVALVKAARAATEAAGEACSGVK